MSEPTCRVCWLETLPEAERERVAAEPITGCVHYCSEHRAVQDSVNAMLARFAFVAAPRKSHEVTFPRA